MRRLIVGLTVVFVGYALWKAWMTRSAAISLEPTAYELTYSIAWGWGMDQKVALSRSGSLFFETSSDWIGIWKRPYNSGLTVYRSIQDGTYYFGASYELLTFDPSTGVLRQSCSSQNIPAHTEFGARLSAQEHEARETMDPGAQHLFNYIEADQLGTAVSVSPPDSRYYANLKYLGKFGLLRSERTNGWQRGNQVGFAPAGSVPEPQLSLNVSCG